MGKSLKSVFNAIKREGYVASDLDKYLLSLNYEDNDRAINVNSPSSIGNCPRSIYYTRTGEQKEGINPRTRRIFDNGTGTHERLQGYLLKQGMLLMDEVPVHYAPHNIQGHTDGLIRLTPSELGVLEIKSINDNGFTRLKDAKPEHKLQAMTYLFCLEERRKEVRSNPAHYSSFKTKLAKEYASHYQHLKGGSKHTREEKINFQAELCFKRDQILLNTRTPLSKCILLYENKNNQEIKEYCVEYRGENKKDLQHHFDIFDYISECVEKGELPERAGSSKSCQTCRWCDFSSSCWVV